MQNLVADLRKIVARADERLDLVGDNGLAFALLRRLRDVVDGDTQGAYTGGIPCPAPVSNPLRSAGAHAAYGFSKFDGGGRGAFNVGVSWLLGHLAARHPEVYETFQTDWGYDAEQRSREAARTPVAADDQPRPLGDLHDIVRQAEHGLDLDGDNGLAFELLREAREVVDTDTAYTCRRDAPCPVGFRHPLRMAGAEAAFSFWQGDTYARAGFDAGVTWAIGRIASEHPDAFARLTSECNPHPGPRPDA